MKNNTLVDANSFDLQNAAQKTLFDHFSKKQKGEENPPSMPNAALPLNHLDASIVPLAHVPPRMYCFNGYYAAV